MAQGSETLKTLIKNQSRKLALGALMGSEEMTHRPVEEAQTKEDS